MTEAAWLLSDRLFWYMWRRLLDFESTKTGGNDDVILWNGLATFDVKWKEDARKMHRKWTENAQKM